MAVVWAFIFGVMSIYVATLTAQVSSSTTTGAVALTLSFKSEQH